MTVTIAFLVGFLAGCVTLCRFAAWFADKTKPVVEQPQPLPERPCVSLWSSPGGIA